MCELFGLSSNRKVNINKELEEFFSHAADNPNGWGIALYDENGSFMDKEDRRADRSKHLSYLLSGKVRAKDAIAHIRLATIGYDEMANTHPFTGVDISGRDWTLAHNGTIFESNPLNKYVYIQDGETDSERIFLYLIDCINQAERAKGAQLDDNERFEVLERVISDITHGNKVNLLIYDGDILYAHTNFKDSLHMRKDEGSVYISTRSLGEGEWEDVPFMRLVAFKDGVLMREGRVHGNEYVPVEENINAIFLAYSGL